MLLLRNPSKDLAKGLDSSAPIVQEKATRGMPRRSSCEAPTMEHGQFIWSEISYLVLKIRFQQYAMRIFGAQGATVLPEAQRSVQHQKFNLYILGGAGQR